MKQITTPAPAPAPAPTKTSTTVTVTVTTTVVSPKMKFFLTVMTTCLLAVATTTATAATTAATATATATSRSSSTPQRTDQLRTLQDGQDNAAWPEGTPIYTVENEVGYAGHITNFFDGVYTITWSDGEVEYMDDNDQIDGLVKAATDNGIGGANGTPVYPMDTPVSFWFDGDDDWSDGIIVDFVEGQYRVEWTIDGSVDVFPPGAELDGMVVAALTTDAPTEEVTDTPTEEVTDTPTEEATDTPTEAATDAPTKVWEQDGYQSYAVGTDVYKEFPGPDGGAYYGTISWYQDGVYSIIWSDKSTESYDNLREVGVMVVAAMNGEDDEWATGTAVYECFEDDGCYYGEIIAYYDGKYTIRWSDGSVDNIHEDKMDVLVDAAYQNIEAGMIAAAAANANSNADVSKGNRSAGGMFMIVLVVIVSLLGAAVCYRKFKTGKEPISKTMDGRASAGEDYKDHPDAAPAMDVPDVI